MRPSRAAGSPRSELCDVPQYHRQLEEVGNQGHLEGVRALPVGDGLHFTPFLLLHVANERLFVPGSAVLTENTVLHVEYGWKRSHHKPARHSWAHCYINLCYSDFEVLAA